MQAQRAEHCQAGKWMILALVAFGQFMAVLDSSIVNISLPAIGRYFGVPLNGKIETVVIGYLVVVGACLLTAGRLADMAGRRPVWIAGLVVFTLGSALCGMAPSLNTLIAARLFQGIGGAMLVAVPGAMLAAAFPRAELGRAMGWNSVIVGVGISAGPTVGGIITQHVSWRWIFFLNVPIGIVALLLTLRFLAEHVEHQRVGLDLAGASLIGIGLAALTLGLAFGDQWGWRSPLLLADLLIAIVALGSVVPVERLMRNPILDVRLFRSRAFTASSICQLLSFVAIFAVSFLMPFYLVQLRGFGPQKAGLLLTPVPVTMAIIAPNAGALADRFGSRWVSSAGMLFAAASLLALGFIGSQTSVLLIVLVLILDGVGQGLFYSANNRTIMSSAPVDRRGVASGILASGKFVGQSLSVAIAGAVFATLGGSAAGRVLAAGGGPIAESRLSSLQGTFLSSFHTALLICCAVALAAAVLAMVGGEAEPQRIEPPIRAAGVPVRS